MPDSDPCNGIETCLDGAVTAGPPVSCTDDGNPCTLDVCNPDTDACGVPLEDGTDCDDGDAFTFGDHCDNGACTPADWDQDQDGWRATLDCDDLDPSVHPGASETCDQQDNDCDGWIDEGLGWEVLPPMLFPRGYACGAFLDGRIYVFGGVSRDSPQQFAAPTGTSEVFDLETWSWTEISPMKYPRSAAACGTLGDRIYVVGGRSTDNTSTVQYYHPATDTWASAPSLSTGRSWAGATVMGDQLFVLGGVGYSYLSSVVRFDRSSNQWYSAGNLSAGRYMLGALVDNGDLYAFGGDSWSSVNTVYDLVERYNPATTTWGVVGHLPEPMSNLQGASFGQENYLIRNGTKAYRFEPSADQFLIEYALLPSGHSSGPVVVSTPVGVFVAGGGGWGPNTAFTHLSCGGIPRCPSGEFEDPSGGCRIEGAGCFGHADGVLCDDGDICTTDDTCLNDQCQGAPVVPCADDVIPPEFDLPDLSSVEFPSGTLLVPVDGQLVPVAAGQIQVEFADSARRACFDQVVTIVSPYGFEPLIGDGALRTLLLVGPTAGQHCVTRATRYWLPHASMTPFRSRFWSRPLAVSRQTARAIPETGGSPQHVRTWRGQ